MSALVGSFFTVPARTVRCHLSVRGLFVLLCGMIAIGPFLGASAVAQATPSSTKPQSTELAQSTPPWEQDSSEQTSREETTAPEQESPAEPTPSVSEDEESVVESVLEVLIFGPIFAILLGLLLAFPSVPLGVSLVMDGGCLRYLLFGLGWIFAIFYGLFTGAVVGEELLGLEFLVKPITYTFMWGYPAVAYWGHKKLQSMPPEQYRAWDQTLTGGALLGFGAGSIAGLFRSAASGFGGFGGGSFGGGGASGSWSGASGAAGSASSTAAGGASSSAAGTATTAAGGSSEAAAVATGVAPGLTSKEPSSPTSSSAPPADASSSRGLWTRLRQWFQKFQWYHGLVFVLATFVFVPLGLGTMQALQNTKFFVFVLVCVVLYSGYKLLHRSSDASHSVASTISSFQGGEASSYWS